MWIVLYSLYRNIYLSLFPSDLSSKRYHCCSGVLNGLLVRVQLKWSLWCQSFSCACSLNGRFDQDVSFAENESLHQGGAVSNTDSKIKWLAQSTIRIRDGGVTAVGGTILSLFELLLSLLGLLYSPFRASCAPFTTSCVPCRSYFVPYTPSFVLFEPFFALVRLRLSLLEPLLSILLIGPFFLFPLAGAILSRGPLSSHAGAIFSLVGPLCPLQGLLYPFYDLFCPM